MRKIRVRFYTENYMMGTYSVYYGHDAYMKKYSLYTLILKLLISLDELNLALKNLGENKINREKFFFGY